LGRIIISLEDNTAMISNPEKPQKTQKNKIQKSPIVFNCELCSMNTLNKKDYSRHLQTIKHLKMYNTYEEIIKKHICPCGIEYKTYNGLWRHKKICNGITKETCNIEIKVEEKQIEEKCDETLLKMVIKLLNDNKEIMQDNKEIIQDNKEMKKQINELCKNGITSIGNNNTISNNQTFNLQVFLNEQCKDAMNIGEFVDSFVIQLDELEHVGSVGYVDGISRIIMNRLKDMDVYKRPFHCSDLKRETMYVKDQNKWEKEEKSNPKLRKAIKAVSQKNMVKVGAWRDANPECRSNKSHLNDQFIKIIRQASGGVAEIEDSEDKIMRRLAKEVGIDKT
jgi:hypothetical protein